ncbi:integrase [Rhodoblastus acidophilus]|uniref:tyrosine-type recombinase/integrase n=1 Tax=Rhodoblastus acidophilus TaxID=1074 RepID=UPI0022248BA1|nr:site-specific integrase [Rhodoblastus acidophilus]MCW2284716.1 integrase [Rhodoblastus acidophilus]MCW2333669.1 integrase [Rhodoblastus acidophilus]
MTLSQATIAFLNDGAGLEATTLRNYTRRLAGAVDMIGPDRLLMDLTPDLLRDFVAMRAREISGIQVRHELTALGSVVAYAAERRFPGAPSTNPCREVPKKSLAKAQQKPRWLKPEQVRAILEQARRSPFWTAFLGLILETGMRHEEALGLQWSEVDFVEGVINLGAAREKTKRGRIIPLTKHARTILAGILRYERSPWVFINPRTGNRYVSIWKSWGSLRQRAGVPEGRIHDLRHTFASLTRQNGMSREDRMAIMGHTSEASHEIYAKGSVKSLSDALEANRPLLKLSKKPEHSS